MTAFQCLFADAPVLSLVASMILDDNTSWG
jgi:hypothetical protein